jgi:signal transduction histidine kinase
MSTPLRLLRSHWESLVAASERGLRDIGARREQDATVAALRALAAHLQSVREEERRRIARDMHDELGSGLTALKMDLAWLRNRLSSETSGTDSEALGKLESMGKLIDATSDAVRSLCTRMRPGILDDLGLPAAVEWQTQELARRTGVNCRLDLQAGIPRLPADRSTAVFRIFQEILTNIARHAHASEVEVHLTSSSGYLRLEVSDNGCGIRERDLAGFHSLGFLGMRERALALGGHLELTPAKPRGTVVKLNVPLK